MFLTRLLNFFRKLRSGQIGEGLINQGARKEIGRYQFRNFIQRILVRRLGIYMQLGQRLFFFVLCFVFQKLIVAQGYSLGKSGSKTGLGGSIKQRGLLYFLRVQKLIERIARLARCFQ